MQSLYYQPLNAGDLSRWQDIPLVAFLSSFFPGVGGQDVKEVAADPIK